MKKKVEFREVTRRQAEIAYAMCPRRLVNHKTRAVILLKVKPEGRSRCTK